ncbi:nose resistant to fluoxetine protein 6-like isoform X2 [Panonychus citri]|uniref:nose resistant to fluoxetine protein 6-like isoform X2 n=1 Tax=Panonychus citri TaxID=50023 RepID=UPI0023081822|nr:nose resistant to fluoxetine protein 6-like isoform X2 [Panonychus citri]
MKPYHYSNRLINCFILVFYVINCVSTSTLTVDKLTNDSIIDHESESLIVESPPTPPSPSSMKIVTTTISPTTTITIKSIEQNDSNQINWESIDSLPVEPLNQLKDNEQFTNKWNDVENGFKKGLKAALRSIFPRIVSMSTDTKASRNCSTGILKWLISLRSDWSIKVGQIVPDSSDTKAQISGLSSPSCNYLMIDLNYITDNVNHQNLSSSSSSSSSSAQLPSSLPLSSSSPSTNDEIDLKAYIFLVFILLIICFVIVATVLDYHYYQDCGVKIDHDSNTSTDCVTTNLMKDDCSSIVSLDSDPSVDNISPNHRDYHHSTDPKVHHYYHLIRSIVLAFSAKENINSILDTTTKPIVRHNCSHHNTNNVTTTTINNDNNNNHPAPINTNGENTSPSPTPHTNGISGSTCLNVNSQISSIHGLRVISMFWIIGGHSYSFAMQWLFFQNSQDIEYDSKMIISQIYANTNFSVDCFFFISGLLVGLSVFKELRRKGRINYLQFYLHRYLRMTPLMMIIIGFCVNLLKYMGSGPSWSESTTMFDQWCQNNWWINSLYLHNFINRENMCLSHSWYSAVDMQLYLVSPLILVPLFWFPFYGILLIVLLLAASMIITASLTIVNHYPPVPYLTNITSRETLDGYYAWIYIKPWCRIGPYLIGIAIAYLIYLRNSKPSIKKRFVIMGWIFAITLNAGILLAMFPAINGYPLSDAVAGLYSATSRTLWSVGLAWIVYACVNGHGGIINSILSWKPFIPLSRLTYSAYLIHPVVIACFYGTRETTFHFSHYLMIYFILGNIVITYIISFGLAVIFEAPIAAIEKIIRSR